MMFKRMMASALVAVLVGFSAAGCATTSCPEGMCKPAGDMSGLDLKISDRGTTFKSGIAVRIAISNNAKRPQVLQVCPSMTLCCVKGLHPLIAFDDTGMGLLDACNAVKPHGHETFLPAGAEFAFDVTIPTECLPGACRKRAKRIKLKFCYQRDDTKIVESNELNVILR